MPAKGQRGSAGASPSQKQSHRTWEGEAPSVPAKANAAQRELRPPKSRPTELGRARLCLCRQRPTRLSGSFALPKAEPPNLGGRGSVCAGKGQRGSAQLRPPKSRPTELGRARLCLCRQRPTRLERELRPPKSRPTELGRARLCLCRQRPTRLSGSFALPKAGPPNLGGRGSVRAGKGQRGSAGASPSRNHAEPFSTGPVTSSKERRCVGLSCVSLDQSNRKAVEKASQQPPPTLVRA